MKKIKLEESDQDGFLIVSEDFTYGPYTIPQGFYTDGASVPECLQWLFDPYDEDYITAAAVHDYLYYKKVGRLKADNIFLKIALKEGTSIAEGITFWVVLRLAGWTHY